MLTTTGSRNNQVKGKHPLKGVDPLLEERVKCFLAGAAYCWCKNHPRKPFSAANLVGGHYDDWEGTPLVELTNLYRRRKKNTAEAAAGVAVGKLLQEVLINSPMQFVRTSDEYVAHYAIIKKGGLK